MTTAPSPPVRPLPVIQGYTEGFYRWCRQHELRFQQCEECLLFRHPPRPMCARCHSTLWQWGRSSGNGAVHTWTIVRKALHPAFATDIPYAVAVVALDEGPSLATWVTGIRPEELRAGLRVRVWFDDVDDKVALPKFAPA